MKIKDWYSQNKPYFNLSEINFIFKTFGLESFFSALGQDNFFTSSQLNEINRIKEGQKQGIPLGFSLKREEFMGWVFYLNSATLIPRPETEILVEKAAEIIKKENSKVILDLGCGCGNIGISLEKIFSGKIKLYLSDLSPKALTAARKNLINLQARGELICSDLFSSFDSAGFDLIITNPPYVETKNIKGSLLYEPKKALDGGKDGFIFLEKIINNAWRYLKNKGYLIIEFGCGQRQGVESLTKRRGKYQIKEWVKDYSGIWRGVVLQKNG